ncbi:hypothetical protein CFOL_v3_10782 [Cephalotus follicularis]|uniref:Uncharacterized protein n=1 Tax=Cephalotus follicularis TaxID=3775 RepID=A0A1Q3BGX5_CEPFO|nr:hypothetical protein CFOL_v3_10782 [Cephalotus follicularis]
MASGWVKSLQCKSKAFEDVYHPNPKHLIPSSSCRQSVQSIKDVIETTKKPTTKSKPKPKTKPKPSSGYPKSDPVQNAPIRTRHSNSAARSKPHDPFFPSLTELQEGHPSRNVVEIIFHTSWGPKAFTGRIEMIFKVQNGSKTVSRFEEYREIVKSRAVCGGGTWDENVRCIADGNEVMRFYCLGPTSGNGGGGASYDGSWVFPGRKGAAICTFPGSGVAHESAGGGRGRKAMLVCRVISGRVSKRIGFESLLDGRVGFDSVSGDNGELLMFDSRAVLPCFLIIYKL